MTMGMIYYVLKFWIIEYLLLYIYSEHVLGECVVSLDAF